MIDSKCLVCLKFSHNFPQKPRQVKTNKRQRYNAGNINVIVLYRTATNITEQRFLCLLTIIECEEGVMYGLAGPDNDYLLH